MTIAEQLTQTMEPLLDAVYAAGKAAGGGGGDNPLKYAAQTNRVFYNANFPEGYELVIDIPSCFGDVSEMFRGATGLKKLTFNAPQGVALAANYFVYTTAARPSSLEELVFPNGVKFGSFSNFAIRASKLHTVTGSIDLSQSTTNDSCFKYCEALVNVSFVEGTITKSLSFAQSANLSDASILSLVVGLADLTGQTTQTLTVHETVYDKIIANYDISSDKNWTLAKA